MLFLAHNFVLRFVCIRRSFLWEVTTLLFAQVYFNTGYGWQRVFTSIIKCVGWSEYLFKYLLGYSITARLLLSCMQLSNATLASNPCSPFWILSRSFGEKLEGEPGRISHVIRWHRDINLPDVKVTRRTECSYYCRRERTHPRQHSYLVYGLVVHEAQLQQPTGYSRCHSFAETQELMGSTNTPPIKLKLSSSWHP